VLALQCIKVRNPGQPKPAKMHMVLDHDGYLPSYAVITDGKQADITIAKTMTFEPGTMLVFDKGYSDYDWWLSLTRGKVNFVTRLKDDAEYGVVERRQVPAGGNIVRDETILLVSQQEIGKEALLRRIEVWVEEKQETMVFLTNNFTLAGATIAAIYKERWQIELFFESSTWCTPSDATELQGSVVRGRVLMGCRSCARPRIVRHRRGEESTGRPNRLAWLGSASTG
jgi:Transposase DDE domain